MGKKAGDTKTEMEPQVEPEPTLTPSPSPVTDTPPPEAPPSAEAEELATVKAEADGQKAALEAERAKRQTAEAELEQLRAVETAAAAEAEVTSTLDGLESKSTEEQLAVAVEALRDMGGRLDQLEGDKRTDIIRDQYRGYDEARKEAGFEAATDDERKLDVAYLQDRGMPSLSEAFYSRNREAIRDKAKAEGEAKGLAAKQLNAETGSEGVTGNAAPAEQMTPKQKEDHDAMVREAKRQGSLPKDYGKTT